MWAREKGGEAPHSACTILSFPPFSLFCRNQGLFSLWVVFELIKSSLVQFDVRMQDILHQALITVRRSSYIFEANHAPESFILFSWPLKCTVYVNISKPLVFINFSVAPIFFVESTLVCSFLFYCFFCTQEVYKLSTSCFVVSVMFLNGYPQAHLYYYQVVIYCVQYLLLLLPAIP